MENKKNKLNDNKSINNKLKQNCNDIESEQTLSYEETSRKLDSIIEKLENGNNDLENVIKLYEEGEKLLKICNNSFNTIEGKITIIKNNIEQIFKN